MSVAKYQMFLKTVERGSFTAAAREMNFTQSGVSHAIGSLEEELGVPRLIRSHGGVTPTADGRELMPYFEKMCAMQHQLEQQHGGLFPDARLQAQEALPQPLVVVAVKDALEEVHH